MSQNSAYHYQKLSQSEVPVSDSSSPPSGPQPTPIPVISRSNVQIDNQGLQALPAVIAPIRPPELKPDNLAGCCCPVGTIYNHEHSNSKLRALLLALEVMLHLAAIAMNILGRIRLQEYVDKYEDDVRHYGFDEMRQEEFENGLVTLKYLCECEKYAYVGFLLSWLVWNVLTRIIFFCCYTPRNLFDEKTKSYIIYEPNLVAKIFFPLSTVYYHEENNFCHLKMLFSACLGCYYSLLCYKPTYKENADARIEVVQVYTV